MAKVGAIGLICKEQSRWLKLQQRTESANKEWTLGTGTGAPLCGHTHPMPSCTGSLESKCQGENIEWKNSKIAQADN